MQCKFCSLSACFLNVLCIDMRVLSWLNVKQCTPSSTGRHSVYTAFRQSSSAYGCNRPKSWERATALGSLSETWYSDLQLLESGSEKIRQKVIRETFSDPLIICCDDIFWYGDWLGALIGNYARYLEEINIREDKLLLYHCLLELGSQKVNVSEHLLINKLCQLQILTMRWWNYPQVMKLPALTVP
jgi:hypothetical protein